MNYDENLNYQGSNPSEAFVQDLPKFSYNSHRVVEGEALKDFDGGPLLIAPVA